jgi:hypothetical protein
MRPNNARLADRYPRQTHPETDAVTDKELILRYGKVVEQGMTPPDE